MSPVVRDVDDFDRFSERDVRILIEIQFFETLIVLHVE